MRLTCALAIAVIFATPALSQTQCEDVSVAKKAVESRDGRWIELTKEQWEFMRGIFAMNPMTPVGLPFGDRAALAQISGSSSGVVFFLDGDKACTPMPVPPELIAMMRDVATDLISHEAQGL